MSDGQRRDGRRPSVHRPSGCAFDRRFSVVFSTMIMFVLVARDEAVVHEPFAMSRSHLKRQIMLGSLNSVIREPFGGLSCEKSQVVLKNSRFRYF